MMLSEKMGVALSESNTQRDPATELYRNQIKQKLSPISDIANGS